MQLSVHMTRPLCVCVCVCVCVCFVIQEEDIGNHVNNDRRLKNLDKKLRELESDIDKKQKEKRGLN